MEAVPGCDPSLGQLASTGERCLDLQGLDARAVPRMACTRGKDLHSVWTRRRSHLRQRVERVGRGSPSRTVSALGRWIPRGTLGASVIDIQTPTCARRTRVERGLGCWWSTPDSTTSARSAPPSTLLSPFRAQRFALASPKAGALPDCATPRLETSIRGRAERPTLP